MPKFRVLFIAFAGIALCSAVLWFATRPPRDPVCKGVKLSEWIAKANRDSSENRLTPEDLRGLGPEAVEFLEHSIRSHVPGETKGLGERLPNALRKYLPESLYRRDSYGSHEQCLFALEQLSNLGPEAQAAIPLLVELLDHSNNSLRDAAAYGLNRIGPASWDEIERTLGHTASKGRRSILFTLTSRLSSPAPDPTQAEVERILEIFLDACADPDPEIKLLGVGGLLNCQGFYSYHFGGLDLPGRAGPVVASCLNRGEGILKVVSARALYYYPESIHLAVPELELMEGDSSSFYSDPARATLQVYQKTHGHPE
ncbi:hypothetical protein [Prosthecobacter sp.]|uniref:HEAT repeat domain-containing protein n=1 Tax=Prosthecobacter sp. TaxID=1965333 RepID=UPI0025D0CDF2|nr:hypothetical protein [Prosthecobacter sp.]